MAVLGMLTVSPMSGYDMKRFCEQSLAHFWHESYGNLYPRLKRLAAAGLIRGRRTARARAPAAIVYSLTPLGRTRFKEWMQEPPEPERIRNELLLKIFFGAQADLALSERRIEESRREQLRIRDGYEAIERMVRTEFGDRAEAPYWLMSVRRGQLLTEARLRWARECLGLLRELRTRKARPR